MPNVLSNGSLECNKVSFFSDLTGPGNHKSMRLAIKTAQCTAVLCLHIQHVAGVLSV